MNKQQRWSRKFIAIMFLQLGNMILLYFDKLPADNYENMTIWIFGAFMLANVGAKVANKLGLKVAAKGE